MFLRPGQHFSHCFLQAEVSRESVLFGRCWCSHSGPDESLNPETVCSAFTLLKRDKLGVGGQGQVEPRFSVSSGILALAGPADFLMGAAELSWWGFMTACPGVHG